MFDDDLGKDDLLGRAILDTRLIVRERCPSQYLSRLIKDENNRNIYQELAGQMGAP